MEHVEPVDVGANESNASPGSSAAVEDDLEATIAVDIDTDGAECCAGHADVEDDLIAYEHRARRNGGGV